MDAIERRTATLITPRESGTYIGSPCHAPTKRAPMTSAYIIKQHERAGVFKLDELLSTAKVSTRTSRELRNVQTEERGVKVAIVDLKDVELYESIHRAMPREAEAEREKRARSSPPERQRLTAGEFYGEVAPLAP